MFWTKSEPGLWPRRCETNGRLDITRMTPPPLPAEPDAGRRITERRATDRRIWAQGLIWLGLAAVPVAIVLWMLNPTLSAAALLLGITGAAVVAAGMRVPQAPPSTLQPAQELPVPPLSPERRLAAARSIEARVAGAACRAWRETRLEPSWSHPVLELTRATFDGNGEVDAIIDLALRIHEARGQLGAEPSDPARDVWRQQRDAIDAAARRLGDRADALIRQRDQAAALSRELAQLAELERLERSAIVVEDLTRETAAGLDVPGGLPVSEQIQLAREAVQKTVEAMTRARAPLAESAGGATP